MNDNMYLKSCHCIDQQLGYLAITQANDCPFQANKSKYRPVMIQYVKIFCKSDYDIMFLYYNL